MTGVEYQYMRITVEQSVVAPWTMASLNHENASNAQTRRH